MSEGMHNQYGDLPTTARLFYLIYSLAVIGLVFLSDRIDSADTPIISAILIAILAILAGIDAWKAYLGHLKLESDRIEARQSKLELEEQKRRDAITNHEDKIKEIFTNLFNEKIEKLKGDVAEKETRNDLLRLVNELKTVTEEYYDSDRKRTKITTQSVPDDVRAKILEAYPVSSHFKPKESKADGN